MITVDFENRGKCGLCDYLYSSIKKQILDGTLKAEEKLPSKRSLSDNLGVSTITVQNAYALLLSEGYIYSLERKGFFVTDLSSGLQKLSLRKKSESASIEAQGESESESKKWVADFTSNSANLENFPFLLWAKTSRKVLNSANEALLERPGVKGILSLRQQIASYLFEFRNMEVDASQIVVGAGTENLYTMLVQFLGRRKFAVENPGYKKIAAILKVNGSSVVPIKVDSQGMSVEDLSKSAAEIAHVSPLHHFPTGVVMSVRRRRELLLWACQKKGRLIIEDDYDSEFRFNGKPLQTLQSIDNGNCIIYINTFSKTLAPSFRISYMVLPKKMMADFEEKMKDFSCCLSSFDQLTLAEFIKQASFARHIIRMRNKYKALRNLLVNAFQKSKLAPIIQIQEKESGLHFLLTIKTELSEKELKKRFEAQKIKISLLKDFYYDKKENADSKNKKTFLINYSGIKKDRIQQIVTCMEDAVLA